VLKYDVRYQLLKFKKYISYIKHEQLLLSYNLNQKYLNT